MYRFFKVCFRCVSGLEILQYIHPCIVSINAYLGVPWSVSMNTHTYMSKKKRRQSHFAPVKLCHMRRRAMNEAAQGFPHVMDFIVLWDEDGGLFFEFGMIQGF